MLKQREGSRPTGQSLFKHPGLLWMDTIHGFIPSGSNPTGTGGASHVGKLVVVFGDPEKTAQKGTPTRSHLSKANLPDMFFCLCWSMFTQ